MSNVLFHGGSGVWWSIGSESETGPTLQEDGVENILIRAMLNRIEDSEKVWVPQWAGRILAE
jgi:hypothetical protein